MIWAASSILTLGTSVGFAQTEPIMTPATPPPVFCTIRINSDDEITVYKKHLEPQGVKFVELTSYGTKLRETPEPIPDSKEVKPVYADDWFDNACKSKIKCDVLLISGHYGAGFSGSETTGLSLSINKMERHACDRTCEGILNAPTKVQLMGCNTLAGKALRRTREEQFAAYLEHGYTSQQASTMIAMLYSDVGRTNRERMEFIFNGVPNVYGYITTGPLGFQVAPSLDLYLKPNTDYAADLAAARANPEYKDPHLSIVPSWMGLRMTKGLTSEAPQWPGFMKTCQLYTAKTKMSQKIDAAGELLASPERKKYLPAIAQFILEMNSDPGLADREAGRIKKISKIPGVKEEVLEILPAMRDVSPYLYMQFLNVIRFFKWMDDGQIRTERVAFIQYKGAEAMSQTVREDICSTGSFSDIKVNELPVTWFTNADGLKALACLKSSDLKVYRIMANNLTSGDPALVTVTAETLKSLKGRIRFDSATRKVIKDTGHREIL